MAAGLRSDEDGYDVPVWVGALGVALACHLAVGLLWLARTPPGGATEELPAIVFDLAPAGAPAQPASGEPVLDPAPEVPVPEVPPAESRPPPAAPMAAEAGPEPPPPMTPPAEVALPAGPRRTVQPARREPSPQEVARERAREKLRERERAEAARQRAEQARTRQEEARRRAAARQGQAAAAHGPAHNPGRAGAPTVRQGAGNPGAAAASAAWRGQVVSILRGRFRGGTGGFAGVNFSVTRGGQITGTRLTSPSGNSGLDGAALAAVRGSVPAPPAGYVGALNFNIRLGVR